MVTSDNVDVIAFTEDSSEIVKYAEETTDVYAFAHYSPMLQFGPNSTITGTLIGLDQDGAFLVEVRQELWKISGGRILRVLSIEQMD